MNVWIRRSLKVGLIAGGFVCIGAGIASAQGTGSSAADQPRAVVQQPLPQHLVKGGALGSVLGDATNLVTDVVQTATPHAGIQPMQPVQHLAHVARSHVSASIAPPAGSDTGSSIPALPTVGLHTGIQATNPVQPTSTASASLDAQTTPDGAVLGGASATADPGGMPLTVWGTGKASVTGDTGFTAGGSSPLGGMVVAASPQGADVASDLPLVGSLLNTLGSAVQQPQTLVHALPTAGLPSADSVLNQVDTLTSALPVSAVGNNGLAVEGLPAVNSVLNQVDSLTSALPVNTLPISGSLPISGLPISGLPISGLPISGLPISGLPSADSVISQIQATVNQLTSALPVNALPVNGLPSADTLISQLQALADQLNTLTSALPVNGLPVSGLNGLPINSLPISGLPISGLPISGLPSADSVISQIQATVNQLTSALPVNALPVNGLPSADTLISQLQALADQLNTLTSALPVNGLPVSGLNGLPVSGLPSVNSIISQFQSLTTVLPISGLPSVGPLLAGLS